jgi:hypothetical protein
MIAAANQAHANNAFAGKLSFSDRATEMAAFDALPAELRRLLNETATKLGSLNVWHHRGWARERGYPVSLTVSKIIELEHFEIEVFAGEHMAKFGHIPPHMNAHASIQRYGQLGPSLHPPRRYGVPIFRPQNRKRVSRRAFRMAKEAA